MKILRNQIQCLTCGDIIVSTHRHDYKWCSCGTVCVDGGDAYLRRVGDSSQYEEQTLYRALTEEEQLSQAAQEAAWDRFINRTPEEKAEDERRQKAILDAFKASLSDRHVRGTD